jgi:hypothetical protein
VNSQKRTVYNNVKIKESTEEEEKHISAKIYKNGVDTSVNPKHARRWQPNSATLPGLSRNRSLPSLNGSRTEKTPMNDYRQNSFPQSSDSRCNDVFYSPEISENKTFHDALTLEVLQAEFSAPSRSTYGLPRAASPENTRSLQRYWTLINNAIEPNVVTPLSNAWIQNTHCFVPVELRDRFVNILEGITKVIFLYSNFPFFVYNVTRIFFHFGHQMILIFCRVFFWKDNTHVYQLARLSWLTLSWS